MSIDEQFLLCFPKPVKLHSLCWNSPLTICWMPMKSNHCCLVTTTNRLRSAFFCQSFTFPSGQMCLPAKADSSNPMSQPPTISFSLSLCFFFLYPSSSRSSSICLRWHIRVDVIHQKNVVVCEERLPLGPSQDMNEAIVYFHNCTWTFRAYCCLLQTWVCVFMYRSRLSCNQLSQDLPRGAFSSQHVFPLAGYYFRQGSQYRKELILIGMPPPTVHVFSSL